MKQKQMQDEKTSNQLLTGRSSAIYLLRTAQQHHVQLSVMADQKASILIGSSFVILAILMADLRRDELSLPLLVFGIFTFIAAILAIMTVLPRVNYGSASDSQMNILFFGHFSKYTEDEYLAKMYAVLETDEAVYTALIRDIYQIGRVLNDKKYRYLAYSYRVFLVGLFAAALAALYSWLTGLLIL